jgi:hypothetical protein
MAAVVLEKQGRLTYIIVLVWKGNIGCITNSKLRTTMRRSFSLQRKHGRLSGLFNKTNFKTLGSLRSISYVE